LGAFVWTERLSFKNLFTKISTNLHFFTKNDNYLRYRYRYLTATAFKDKLYTNTIRLVFLVHIEFTKRRH
jgi:hypothetical protein